MKEIIIIGDVAVFYCKINKKIFQNNFFMSQCVRFLLNRIDDDTHMLYMTSFFFLQKRTNHFHPRGQPEIYIYDSMTIKTLNYLLIVFLLQGKPRRQSMEVCAQQCNVWSRAVFDLDGTEITQYVGINWFYAAVEVHLLCGKNCE